ncbi:MAG: tetratricopeptide repeat protein [Ahniella sp.]|nr:tetratricopeptide repeat protein [Ahniella sp.]
MAVLWSVSIRAEPGQVARDWQAVSDVILEDPKQAEVRYRSELDALPSDAVTIERVLASIKLKRAEFALDRDDPESLGEMLALADQAATLGEIEWAMLAWRDSSRRFFLRGDYVQAQSSAQRVLDAARQSGARKDEAQSLNDLGVLAKRRGDIRSAMIHYENALSIRRTINDRVGMAQTLGNLALVEKNRGGLLRALAFQREAHPLFVESAREHLIANSFDSLGLIYLALEDSVEAERQFREAMRIGDLPKNQDNILNTRCNLASALLSQGRVDEAEVQARLAYDHSEKRGLKPAMTSAGLLLATLSRRRGDFAAADRFTEGSIVLARGLGDTKEIIEPLIERTELRLAQGQADAAQQDIDEALALARRDQMRLLERTALEVHSRVLMARGLGDQAFQSRLEFERVSAEILGPDTMRRMAELLDAERERASRIVPAGPVKAATGRVPAWWLALGVLALIAARLFVAGVGRRVA